MPSYTLLEQLGQGAMGVVHRAVHQSTGRLVALKQLRPELALSPPHRRRFLAEAKIASRVTHPHAVRILDSGEEEGLLFLAMELVEGRPLDEARRADPAAIQARAVDILRMLFDALAAVHEAGVAHRDLKPANVMLRPDGAAVLMDFSVSKDLDSDGTVITRPGQVIGTPLYLAPESLGGMPMDARSDLWSMGCLAYWLYTGEAPFQRPSLPAVIGAVLDDPVPRLEEHCPRMPAELREIVLELLEKEPARRAGPARAVLERLSRIQPQARRETTSSPRPQLTDRPPKSTVELQPDSTSSVLRTPWVIFITFFLLTAAALTASRSTPRAEVANLTHVLASLLRIGTERRLLSLEVRLRSVPPSDATRRSQVAREAAADLERDLAAADLPLDTLDSLPADSLLYEELMRLDLLGDLLEALGQPRLPALTPRLAAHRAPWASDPGGPGESIALVFDRSGHPTVPSRTSRHEELVEDGKGPLVLGIPRRLPDGSPVRPLRELVTEVLHPGRHSSGYRTPRSIPLRSPEPGERVLLTAHVRGLMPGRALRIAFSKDGLDFADSVVLRAGSGATGDRLHHGIPASFLGGSLWLRLECWQPLPLESLPDREIGSLSFHYLGASPR